MSEFVGGKCGNMLAEEGLSLIILLVRVSLGREITATSHVRRNKVAIREAFRV